MVHSCVSGRLLPARRTCVLGESAALGITQISARTTPHGLNSHRRERIVLRDAGIGQVLPPDPRFGPRVQLEGELADQLHGAHADCRYLLNQLHDVGGVVVLVAPIVGVVDDT